MPLSRQGSTESVDTVAHGAADGATNQLSLIESGNDMEGHETPVASDRGDGLGLIMMGAGALSSLAVLPLGVWMLGEFGWEAAKHAALSDAVASVAFCNAAIALCTCFTGGVSMCKEESSSSNSYSEACLASVPASLVSVSCTSAVSSALSNVLVSMCEDGGPCAIPCHDSVNIGVIVAGVDVGFVTISAAAFMVLAIGSVVRKKYCMTSDETAMGLVAENTSSFYGAVVSQKGSGAVDSVSQSPAPSGIK